MDTTEIIEGWPDRNIIERDMVAGYTIVREIGKGASGTVYLAEEDATGASVAIKVISTFHSQNRENLARLIRESETLQSINHPNIVRGISHGSVKDRHYVVMEYVMGETVAALLRRLGRIPEKESLDIVAAVAGALDAAQKQRIIHRDIKPSNIIQTAEGVVKLMDFGLARQEFDSTLTTHGAILGTPIYVSPEQARGDSDLDIRTDIYSLGITLFHMVVGEPPFSEFNTSLLLTKKITDDIPDPRRKRADVSDSMAALILRMCQRERRRRIPDPATLLVAIEKTRAGHYPGEGEAWPAHDHTPGRLEQSVKLDDVTDPVLRSIVENPAIPRKSRFVDRNEVVFYEDDNSRQCFLLLVGRLEILKAGRQIAVLDRPGTFIGEMSTLLNSPRTATVRALEPTVLLELTDTTFREFLHGAPEMAWHLAVTLAQRLEQSNRNLKEAMARLQIVKDYTRVLRRELGE